MPAIDQPTIETLRRPRPRLLILAAIAVATMLVPVGGESIEAAGSSEATETTVTFSTCAGSGGNLLGHSRPYLTGFTGVTPGSQFYAAPEAIGNATPRITVTSADLCSPPLLAGQADYLTQNGSATTQNEDYTATSGTSNPLCVNNHPEYVTCEPSTAQTQQAISVPINDDGTAESAVESFLFRLQNGDPFPLSTIHPTEAPIHVIDNDGANRVSLEPTLNGTDTVAYQGREPSFVDVPVFWAGPGTPQDVHYTIGSAPGSPTPTPGVDYTVPTANPIPAGGFGADRTAFIRFEIRNDKDIEPDEVLTITLEPDPGTYDVAAGRASTTLTIRDTSSDAIAPVTRFHHPRQGLKYRRADYRIREFHTFYKDEGGSGMAKAHMALRRKLENGTCAWWRGGKFRRGPCSKKVWKVMKHDEQNFLFYYRFKPLRPTVGTNIKHYRAWTRGRDFAGNVEKKFTQGRNQSTFWVRKK